MKWNYEIRRQKQRKTVLEKLKNDAVYQIKTVSLSNIMVN